MKMHLLSNRTIIRTLMVAFFSFATVSISAQQVRGTYTVNKGETLFGIAKKNGVTINEIINVNPSMKEAGYVLKTGAIINIPVHGKSEPSSIAKPSNPVSPTVSTTTSVSASVPAHVQAADAHCISSKTVTIGVMLPLHDINGDGKRMIEYYRGMLLALKQLKSEGYNVEMNAWNVPDNADLSNILQDQKISKSNIIFGPLYTKQVPELASFCQEKNIRLVIPFSISGNDVQKYPCIYQVYQTQEEINNKSINEFISYFNDAHPVFIDCNDASSNKGLFTSGLRIKLDNAGIRYSITNIKNNAAMFNKAFVTDKRNVVILNTGKSPELGQVIKLLDQLTAANPSVKISLYGYSEWFMYNKVYNEKFKKYDAHIPSVYDYNTTSSSVTNIEKLYSSYYGQPMLQAIPRFAITGYDQLMFFVKGIDKYGEQFHGLASQNQYTSVQTSYSFDKLVNGGYKNNSFKIVRYK